MSNKSVPQRFFEVYGNNHDTEAAVMVFAPDVRVHANVIPGGSADLAGYRQVGEVFLKGFPNLAAKVLDQVEEGEKVVTRVLWSGTHTGDLMGIPPTGKSFQSEGIVIDRIVNGKIQERWEIGDLMTMMQQLGVVPALS